MFLQVFARLMSEARFPCPMTGSTSIPVYTCLEWRVKIAWYHKQPPSFGKATVASEPLYGQSPSAPDREMKTKDPPDLAHLSRQPLHALNRRYPSCSDFVVQCYTAPPITFNWNTCTCAILPSKMRGESLFLSYYSARFYHRRCSSTIGRYVHGNWAHSNPATSLIKKPSVQSRILHSLA